MLNRRKYFHKNLIKQVISFGVHGRQLPKGFISYKADLMSILK